MKKFILMVGIFATSACFACGSPSIKNEISEQLTLDLSTIELDEFHQDFVVVSFDIKDYQIHIIDIQGSQEKLIQMIINELSDIQIQREYSEMDVFNYKFIFKKA